MLAPAPLPPPDVFWYRFPRCGTISRSGSAKAASTPFDLDFAVRELKKPRVDPQCGFVSWWRGLAKLFGTFRGAASERKYHLNEEAAIGIWYEEEQARRGRAGEKLLLVWRKLRAMGKGTRQDIGLTFFVECVLNTESMLCYLDSVNHDNRERNQLAKDVEFGLRSELFQAEALARAVIAVSISIPLKALVSQISAPESFQYWECFREAIDELPNGSAHATLLRSVALRLPRWSAWLVETEQHRAETRDAVLALFNDPRDRVARLARWLMLDRPSQMRARIFNNPSLKPKNFSGNAWLSAFSAVNDECESMFGGTKMVHDALRSLGFESASAIACFKRSRVLDSPYVREQKRRKAARKKDPTLPRFNPCSPCSVSVEQGSIIDDILSSKTLQSIVQFAKSKAGRKVLIRDPQRAARKVQAQGAHKRRVEAAIKHDKRQQNIAKRFKMATGWSRANTSAELNVQLTNAEVEAIASTKVGGEKRSGGVRKKALTENKVGAVVEAAKRKVLERNLMARKYIFGDKVPALRPGKRTRPLEELHALVAKHIADEDSSRPIPPAPHVLGGKDFELGASHTALSRQLKGVRERMRQEARASYYAAGGGELVHVAPGALLPQAIDGGGHAAGGVALASIETAASDPLRAAGLGRGSNVWNPNDNAAYRILEPDFADATGAELVCLVYPTMKYPNADEEAMKLNPAGFEFVRVCSHGHVISWLDGLAEGAPEDG